MSIESNVMRNILDNNIEALEDMRKNGVDIFHINSETPSLIFAISMSLPQEIHTSSSENDKDLSRTIDYLLQYVDINERDKDGNTAIIVATRGIRQRTYNDLGTCTGIRLAPNFNKIFLNLLKYRRNSKGPNLNLLNNNGDSALYFAALSGESDLVSNLLSLWQVDVKTALRPGKETLLEEYDYEVIDVLIDAGILTHLNSDTLLAVAVSIKEWRAKARIILDKILDYCHKNHKFDSPTLQSARSIVTKDHKEAMEFFSHGVPIDLFDNEGRDLVFYAMYPDIGLPEVSYEFRRNARLGDGYVAVHHSRDPAHMTPVRGPIYYALQYTLELFESIKQHKLNHTTFCRMMTNGARLDFRTLENYNTPLHLACSLDIELANMILQWISENCSVEGQKRLLSLKNRNNQTVLDLAIKILHENMNHPKLLLFKNLVQKFVDQCVTNTMKFVSGIPHSILNALPCDLLATIYRFDNDYLGFDNSQESKAFLELAFAKSISSNTLSIAASRSLSRYILNSFKEAMSSKMNEALFDIILDYCGEIQIGNANGGLHYQWSSLKSKTGESFQQTADKNRTSLVTRAS